MDYYKYSASLEHAQRFGSAIALGPRVLLTAGHVLVREEGGLTVDRRSYRIFQTEGGALSKMKTPQGLSVSAPLRFAADGADLGAILFHGFDPFPGAPQPPRRVDPRLLREGERIRVAGYPGELGPEATERRYADGVIVESRNDALIYRGVGVTGGQSGSPIIHIASGVVIGVHIEGLVAHASGELGLNKGTPFTERRWDEVLSWLDG